MASPPDSNPLLEIQFPIPFDSIRAQHVEPAIRQLVGQASAQRAALASSQDARTFQNTLGALDRLTDGLDYAMGVVKHLEGVATYPELRAAHNVVEPLASEFYSSIPLDQGVWTALRQYAETPDAAALTGVRRRFLVKTMDSFRRHGADLDPDGKARLAEMDVSLSELTTKFSQNVLDATNAFELVITDASRLAGLPPSAVAAARQSAERKGVAGWRFTLQAPSFTAVMTYLDDASLREQVWRAFVTRAASGEFDNREILRRILELRRRKANLVGFRDFADFALADRMAKTGDAARGFLTGLKSRTDAHFQREIDELEAFCGRPLKPWDVAYFTEQQRRALYDFDEAALRPYFPLASVVAGLFEIAHRLFGVRVVRQSGAPLWDPQTGYYAIHDEDGALLGCFYADWYPRENKRGGAWMDAFITATDGPHLGTVCGNLTPPIGETPALLTHREVETIFHEFGHLLHHTLTRVEVRSLAGTNVAWDFVELPSQIMENWCWEREALDLFARHYQTGEAIPEELFQKMKRARRFRGASSQMRQLGFGFVDLALHAGEPPEDVVAFSRGILNEFSPVELPAEHAAIASFTHLFAEPMGYAAAYYSYKWAEVLDADAFTRFRASGVFDRETGRSFRETILEKGDSEDPADLYRAFMGRDPDTHPLLERLGLVSR